MKHSKLGIASCIAFALVVCCGLFVAHLALTVPQYRPYEQPQPSPGDGWARFFHAIVAMAAGWLVSFIGFCLGLAGLKGRQRKRATAAAGAILNGLVAVPVAVCWLADQFNLKGWLVDILK